MPLTLLDNLRREARELVPRVDAPVEMRLQNVCVRLLFDPGFVARLYETKGAAVSDLGIPRELLEQLLEVDPRVWSADALRPQRALKVLLEEYKISTALFLAEGGRLSFLHEFFASDCFHGVVQGRGYLSLAFLEYLSLALEDGSYRSPHAIAVLALEGWMAFSRRSKKEARDPANLRADLGADDVRLAPGIVPLRLPGGTLTLVQHMETWFFEIGLIPAQALCEDLRRPEPLPDLDFGKPESWLLEPAADQRVEIGGISDDFHHVLEACARSGRRRDIEEAVASFGLRKRAWGMVEALVEAGVLIGAS